MTLGVVDAIVVVVVEPERAGAEQPASTAVSRTAKPRLLVIEGRRSTATPYPTLVISRSRPTAERTYDAARAFDILRVCNWIACAPESLSRLW